MKEGLVERKIEMGMRYIFYYVNDVAMFTMSHISLW